METVGQTLGKSLNFSKLHFQNVITISIFQGCYEKKLGYTALAFNMLVVYFKSSMKTN